MYLPRHFEETSVEAMHALIRAHPLGTLVTLGAAGLNANHIPFVVHADMGERGTLHAHVARANPVWSELAQGGEALVIFQGPQAFISPAWYPTKNETGKVVPTWNYVAVHAYGPLRAIEDRDWLRRHVERLTASQEEGRPVPWRVADAPPDYIERQLGAIVGLEIPIVRLVGKWKVSQNRTDREREGVVAGLDAEGSESAAEMSRLVRCPGNKPGDGA